MQTNKSPDPSARVMPWSEFERLRSAVLAELGGTVLDLGAGDGSRRRPLPAAQRWIGLEPDPRLAARLRRRTTGRDRVLEARAEDIPLPDASVDAVLCSFVLCSVDDPATALVEAQRLVTPATRLLDHGCRPTRDSETELRRSGLVLRSLQRLEVPVVAGWRVPLVLGLATRP
ncbi:class I SAM-dependent methyltransferase [Desertihabitans brevis]|uniref:class I SAM-dependent methyltransferase n=1 Tax=Desertihabitans brevis TaxID=2268447 RepID=UPI0013146240|nr:class I SAM-dependent methyltransferase [Desertihabitans brevis]